MLLPNVSLKSEAVSSNISLDTSAPNDKEGHACHCDVCERIGEEPSLIPGRIWVPVWSIDESESEDSEAEEED